MAALGDPNSLPYEAPQIDLPALEPQTLVLKDGSVATVYPTFGADMVAPELQERMLKEFNLEIEAGQTYPQTEPLSIETFRHYWMGRFAAILIQGTEVTPTAENVDWDKLFLGTFYVKPNYPGRCSHVCNAGFLVNTETRGKGVGRRLGEVYIQWAPYLGYTYSVFNLVFATNIASIRIWESLGFERIGKVKRAGKLKGIPEPVDAIVFGRDLILGETVADANGVSNGYSNGH
uniref:ARAD1B14212p n=1 Tax=Blastobotrys adeninivorans TaxID=409370 RepID=A0A060TC59_BLAAD